MIKEQIFQKSRLLLVYGGDFPAVAGIVQNVLTLCGFQSAVNDVPQDDTDFIILSERSKLLCEKDAVRETAVLCTETDSAAADFIRPFRVKVVPFEERNLFEGMDEICTYSMITEQADVSVKNIKETDEAISFELLGTGVIGRVKLPKDNITVLTALEAAAMLIAMGVPIAAVLNGINGMM